MKNNFSNFHDRLILGLVLVCGSLLQLTSATAQQMPEPAAIISIAPIEKQLNDVKYLAEAASEMMGQMSGIVRMQAEGFLPGVDFTRPSGAMLYFKEGAMQPDSIGFIPVKNIDDILDKISEFAEVEEDGDMVTITPDNGQELTLIHQGDYAFVSDKAEMLKNLPTDPGSLIAEQSKQYNLSAKLFPQRIPADLRQQALDWMRESYESQVQEMDELQAELQQANFDMQMQQMELMINDVEAMLLGFNADKESERVLFDINIKSKSGSELATKFATAMKADATQFAGFLMKDAAFTVHSCSGIGKDDAEMYVKSMQQMRDALLEEQSEEMDSSQIELLKRLSGQLIDTVQKTLMAGTLDMGGVAFTDDGINAAFGAKIVDARQLETSIKEIVAEAKSTMEADQVVFNLNSGSHNGFNQHEILVSVDEEEIDDAIKKLFGDKIRVVLGIADDKVYVGIGKDPVATLKKSIDANASPSAGKTDQMGQYNFFIAPIMNLIAQVQVDEPMVERMRAEIAKAGKDRVRMTVNIVDGEMKMQMEIQDGIFQMVGVAAEAMQGGMGGGGADF